MNWFRTTQNDLLREGWTQVDVYGIYEIWAKGDERLLFDPSSQQASIYNL